MLVKFLAGIVIKMTNAFTESNRVPAVRTRGALRKSVTACAKLLGAVALFCLYVIARGADLSSAVTDSVADAKAAEKPGASVEDQPETKAPDATRVDLLEFDVQGNTVLPKETIEQTVYPHLGPGRPVDEVQRARADLEKAYHDSGYLSVYVDVPPQRITHGVVILKVTEGVIGRTRVKGAKYTLPSRIREEAPSTAEGTIPFFPDLQKDIEQVNRAPGVKVVPVLQSGRTPGTMDISLNVVDQPPLSAWLDLNNAYSPDTTKLRLSGGVAYSNLFQLGHSLSLQYQVAPESPSESSALSASYTVPLEDFSRYLSVYAVHSSSNVATFGNLVTVGNGDIVGTRYILPLPSRASLTHQFSFGLDYKDFGQSVQQGDTPAQEVPIHYWTLNANYGGRLDDARGDWLFGAGTVLGLRGLDSSETEFNAKRYMANGNFAAFKINLQRDQKLYQGGWALMAHADLQLADQPLISNEQFTAGGVGSVRGYLLSEALGDVGSRLSLELHAPLLARNGWGGLKNLQPYLFADGAYLRVLDPLPSQQDFFDLASVGAGLQMNARSVNLGLNLAWPLIVTTSTPDRNVRIQFDAREDF
ncbi:MAG: ShlB/FhaC/HecB family hemolysin secretion/activation protein [Thiobacillaceae bacterium]